MQIVKDDGIGSKIYNIRGIKVMLDSDLAKLYEVETKRINEAVKNNPDKFPHDFMFVLTQEEEDILRSKISTFKESLKGRKYRTKVFTEQGVYMLATVLKSKVATDITINIMRTFSKIREFALNYKDVVLELRDFKEEVNQRLGQNENDTKQNTEYIKQAFEMLTNILDDTEKTEKKLIGFRPK
jgi:gas vesicle protein